MRRTALGTYHSVIHFLFFCFTAVLTMITMNPVCVLISFLCGCIYTVFLNGLRALLKGLPFYLIMTAFITILNLTNGLGLTVLFYIGQTPVTLEALLYGASAGLMLSGAALWVTNCMQVMTADRFLSIFGHIAPTTAMMAAMVFKYIPQTRRKAKDITATQHCMTGCRTPKNALRAMGILLTWSMESSIETADAMRARGYGQYKRSLYTNERFSLRDARAAILIAGLGAAAVMFAAFSADKLTFYPYFRLPGIPSAAYAVYTAFFLIPLILESGEYIRWQLSR